MDTLAFLSQHHSEVLIVVLLLIVVFTLLIVVPQLLRSHLRKAEMVHLEQIKALEQGLAPRREDDRSRVAGRTAMLVPMVVIICAGTVTCFVTASKFENIVAVLLTVWVVAGVVSLAAITGGVALIGRLAQLQSSEDAEEEANPLEAP